MRHAFFATVLMIAAMPASAGFYKCQDANGKTYFSDRSCTTKASGPLKSGDDVPRQTEEEAKVRGGSMSVIGAPDMTRGALADLAASADRRIERQDRADAYERQVGAKLDENQALKNKLAKEHPRTYKELERKSGGDLSRCTVTRDPKNLISNCM